MTDEQINKMWHSHIIEHYLACKWNTILTYATMQMNHEGPGLNEVSRSPKDKYCMIPLLGGPGVSNSETSETEIGWGLQGAGGGEGRELFTGRSVRLRRLNSAGDWMVGMAAVWLYLMPLKEHSETVKMVNFAVYILPQ